MGVAAGVFYLNGVQWSFTRERTAKSASVRTTAMSSSTHARTFLFLRVRNHSSYNVPSLSLSLSLCVCVVCGGGGGVQEIGKVWNIEILSFWFTRVQCVLLE